MSAHRDRFYLLLVVVALTASGCTRSTTSSPNEPSNLETWVQEKKNKPPPPLEPLPVMQQFENFVYQDQGLRDPFSPDSGMTMATGSSGPRPDSNRPKQALEQFPLDSLDMVGTIGTGRNLVALVMAPDKVTYRVRPGNYLGQSDGRVTSVHNDRIDLVELVPDGAGGWLERPASIALDDQ